MVWGLIFGSWGWLGIQCTGIRCSGISMVVTFFGHIHSLDGPIPLSRDMLGPLFLSCLLEEDSIETLCFKHFVRANGAPCYENAHQKGWIHKRVLQGTSCETVVQYINGFFTVWQSISSITLSIFLQPWTRHVDQRYFTTGRMKHGCFGLVSGSITCQWPQLRWWRQSAWQPSGFWGANRNSGGWFLTSCIYDSMGCRELLSSITRKWLGNIQRQLSQNDIVACQPAWKHDISLLLVEAIFYILIYFAIPIKLPTCPVP